MKRRLTDARGSLRRSLEDTADRITTRQVVIVVSIAAGAVVLGMALRRTLPELVRYLRMRRM
jgi:hypothetical protein